MKLRIGTRGSRLAIVQSEWVKEKIQAEHPQVEVELLRIKTTGDRILDSPLSEVGGKGLFVKEIEEALLSGKVDLAVHSMKDVPAELPEDLHISVFPERENPFDAFVSLDHEKIHSLPEGSTVGTSSLRRSAQLLTMRPDLNVVPIRGNVDTRLKKLESGDFQAIILAAAGLYRLGFSKKIRHVISPDEILPAVGQGALGLETRRDKKEVQNLLRFLNHEPTELTVRAERAYLKELEGGCQVPIAAYGRLEGKSIVLQGLVAELDGSRVIKDEIKGPTDRPEDLGVTLAKRVFASGAGKLLAEIYSGQPRS